MITRFAPTPSGYLHIGNAVNAQLVAWLAAAHDGTVALRIDDMDAARCRPEYVEDVFEVLGWLGIDWQLGPRDPNDLDANHSLQRRTEYYRAELWAAAGRGLELYACRCSRSQLGGPPTGGCPGGCRQASLEYVAGETALRAHVPVHVCPEIGDAVLWRRDDLPAYHLASVVEDRDLGVTHVVRGDDLRASTAIQLFLAPYLDAVGLTRAHVLHHALLTDADGAKLSKSTLGAGPMRRTRALRRAIADAAAEAGARVGISPPA